VTQTESHTPKFRNLISSSWLEIVFEGRPKGRKAPNYKAYKYKHSEALVVVFEAEVRRVKRYVPPNCDYDTLEI
jgi:hypothetical protein